MQALTSLESFVLSKLTLAIDLAGWLLLILLQHNTVHFWLLQLLIDTKLEGRYILVSAGRQQK